MSAGLSAAAIGGIAAGVGSIGGAVISSMGAQSAANTQANAANAQVQEQANEFNTIQGLLKPYSDFGSSAIPGYNAAQTNYINGLGQFSNEIGTYGSILGQLNGLTGANGAAAQQAAINGLKQQPLYTNSMNLGQQAILANASATGGLRGGNTIASLGYLPGQILSNVMQQQVSNLGTSLNGQSGLLNGQAGFLTGAGNLVGQYGNILNLGENAAAGTGQAAMSTGNNITSLLGQQGAIQAGSILAGSNAMTQGINGVSGALGTYLKNGFPSGGASGFNPAYQAAYSGFDNPSNYG